MSYDTFVLYLHVFSEYVRRVPKFHLEPVNRGPLYYSLNIGNKEYWANVKVHKDYGEVLYTIESTNPKDLKRGVRQ